MATFDITKKVGPMPLWGWLGVTTAGAYLFIRHQRTKAAAAAGTDQSGQAAGSGGQFSSTVTSKDAAGNSSTYTASGPNSSIQSPAQLSWAAGPMGYRGGDVYVNDNDTPAAGPAGPPGPQGPPGTPGTTGPPAPHPPRNPDWGKWETVTSNDDIRALTARVLGTGELWDKVWNDPVNKALHDSRGDPAHIQPGDVVWVFNGWRPGWKPPADFVPYNADPAHPTAAGPTVKPPPPDVSQN